jgi:hypothetical protein
MPCIGQPTELECDDVLGKKQEDLQSVAVDPMEA